MSESETPERLDIRHERLRGLLDSLENEHGPIDSETMEEVREAWPAAAERNPNVWIQSLRRR